MSLSPAYCATLAALCVAGLCLHAGAAELSQTDKAYTFSNGRLSLTLDKATGAWTELRLDGAPVAQSPADWQSFDLRQDTAWVTGPRAATPKLLDASAEGADGLRTVIDLGQWRLTFHYRLGAPDTLLTRSVDVQWNGTQSTKLKGFWLGTPRVTTAADSYYYLPGNYPPLRRDAPEFTEGQQRGTGKSLCPVIAQLQPALSALWISDALTPNSDRGSANVKEYPGALGVTQSFDAQGIMKPGDVQHIGDACLWLLPIDGEECLYRIHDWMRLHGHAIPADRPQWFREAILYSFHPGGTIGSSLKDLGGFVPATKFLDQIAGLGANSIWIMPIEDLSLYNPRDYYQFQQGLGTAEEYRALVSRAHGLGLHVLQDCVPHGGSNTFPRAKEHPEWLVYTEEGTTLSYWCFDFNWPTWREYMAQVARHYVTQFDVDGYRVDAVGGSKIANWNPDIPYARASFALLQGGLNMLRSLRAAVKESKPAEGGLLAETEGSVYGTVSDAVYDFTSCYTVFQDVRKVSPAEYVTRLRRWLHEQQYAETPDLLRLRHIESHDSLRSGLWYGLEPQRALMALSAWIHGIPLIYHEAETGNTLQFRRIFGIRKALPELNGGAADYVSVQAPPEVFACLRSDGPGASVVLINFAESTVTGNASVPLTSLPEALRTEAFARNMWTGAQVAASVAGGSLELPFTLAPYGFTVLALRADAAPAAPEQQDWWAESPDAPHPAPGPVAGAMPFGDRRCTGWVDLRTGLLNRVDADGSPVVGQTDLFLPGDLAAAPAEVTVQPDGAGIKAIRKMGDGALQLTYRAQDNGIEVSAQWLGEGTPAGRSLALPFAQATHWYSCSGEGVAQDEYHPRHLTGDGVTGSIYRKPQGTNVLWDSDLHPAGAVVGAGSVGARTSGGVVGVDFSRSGYAPHVQLLDRIGDRHELTALISLDPPSGAKDGNVSFTIAPGRRPQEPAPQRLRPVAGGWEYENDHFALRLGRSGMITQIRAKGPDAQTVLEGGELYTDNGFASDRTRYAAGNDVEATARFWEDNEVTYLHFEGQIRGSGRFELLRPPIDFAVDYALGDGPSFRMTSAVRPTGAPQSATPFLGLMSPLPQVRTFRFSREGKVLAEGDTGDGSARVGETSLLPGGPVPDRVLLGSATGPLLRLDELKCTGVAPLNSAFVHGRNFFLTWYDAKMPNPGAGVGEWRSCTALWTPGGGAPAAVGKAPELPATPRTEGLLQDPGFELALGRRTVSVVRGEALPILDAGTQWRIPAGGRAVAEPVHDGHAAAEVINTTGDYLLWRQALPPARLPVGSKWRLSAWVKGEDIVRGDPTWKVGCIRFGVQTTQMQYFSCPELLGTFDWKLVTAEVTIPEGAVAVSVEAGLNGALGKMWIDDMKLEPVP
jgi:hypothetical protein